MENLWQALEEAKRFVMTKRNGDEPFGVEGICQG